MPGETDELKGDVKTPAGEEGLTPKEPETLTKQEADVQTAEAVQTVKTDVGRLTAELKKSQNIASAAITRLKEIEEEGYRRQEEVARDDPDELSRIRGRRLDAERTAKLEEREAKIQTQLGKILQSTAKSLSAQYNVTGDALLKYAGEDADAMEELAKSYGERKPGETITTRMKEPPDDGKTKGGGAGLTVEDVSKMSPEEQNRRSKEIAALPLGTS